MDELILDTTFLIDLEREARAHAPAGAHAFLEEHPEARLCISWITAGELACGPGTGARKGWEGLVRQFHRLALDGEVAWRYGQTYRFLRDNGLLIGGNDLWIAATALAAELPLVTRNREHFRRVPELEVIVY